MSYFTQMAGLAYHNFASAAAGIVLAIVMIRGIARKETENAREFLGGHDALPAVGSAAALPGGLAGLGVSGSDSESEAVHDGGTDGTANRASDRMRTARPRRRRSPTQVIAQGPVASQEVIKDLGTNGGGFFNANSAHPFENPTPLSNFLQLC